MKHEARVFEMASQSRKVIYSKQTKTKSYVFGMRVVLRKTVVGDWRFDYLSGSHLQSQESLEDDYRSGSQNVSHQQQSFSRDYPHPDDHANI